ncbi:MAG: hypothetical protein CMI02_07390 [Oceanospirillaceae bacterium]|nr:hypothetical protein [Oceanospirillaceae bacterium]
MAAETLTADRALADQPVFKPQGSGALAAAYGTYEIGANVEDGDIFEMCRVPAGAVLLGGWFYGDDLDTGTETLDMDIGWAANGGSGTYDSADPDGLGNLGVLTGDAFAAGNVSPVAGLMYPLSGKFATGELPSFTKETVIQIEANAAANAGGTGTVSLVVFYVAP